MRSLSSNGGMDPLPKIQRALKVRGPREVELHETCPLPALEDDEILVRVRCVAINPVDAKVLDMAPRVGATAGCEFAGDVVKMGPSVKNDQLKAGVAVFGCVWGNHPNRPDNGAFAEFVAVAGDLVYLLPPHLSYQQGASLGVALPTVGMAVYYLWPLRLPYTGPGRSPIARGETRQTSGEAEETRELEATTTLADRMEGAGGHVGVRHLTRPSSPPSALGTPRKPGTSRYVLVYGGSTVCGAMALQMIRKSGLVPVCTCSARNFALVKALGAQEAFDYHSPTCGDDIRRHTADTLAYALDCITDLASMRICYTAMGRDGGKYMGLEPVPLRAHTRRDIKPNYILVYTMFGKEVTSPRPFGRPARPKDRVFAERWYRGTQTLVDIPGEIHPHPLDQGSDGLHGVIKGLDRMRKGDVSGVKLVYEL
ncbi:Enoyl reductase LovC [Tolypocladium ophioglossoides CBS 100239]|uniref:Enoyl reductase LovC n=1 Tax=Tolypocladium ophioglossoides (strain CBS 100239) TaxID=1163406 RepID=A0A0L0MZ03_TOLOC|nr:Enoyl reductase LovC [Tolypocladium ophioglossoides CBS 100239]